MPVTVHIYVHEIIPLEHVQIHPTYAQAPTTLLAVAALPQVQEAYVALAALDAGPQKQGDCVYEVAQKIGLAEQVVPQVTAPTTQVDPQVIGLTTHVVPFTMDVATPFLAIK